MSSYQSSQIIVISHKTIGVVTPKKMGAKSSPTEVCITTILMAPYKSAMRHLGRSQYSHPPINAQLYLSTHADYTEQVWKHKDEIIQVDPTFLDFYFCQC